MIPGSARRALIMLALAGAVGATAAPPAWAHARLEASSPRPGATLPRAPARVSFSFDEPVETAFGAIRVFDVRAGRVDDARVTHAGDTVAVGLRRGLADGTYTATYRVISADGHPVSGGFSFSVGRPSSAAAPSVGSLLQGTRVGRGPKLVLAGAHAVQYGAIAIAGGLLVFLAACWRPALARLARPVGRRQAAAALDARARRVGLVAGLAGIASAAVAVVAEGAIAGASSLPAALDPRVLRDVAGTRAGAVLAAQLALWLALVVLLLAVRDAERRRARLLVTGIAATVLILVVSPALEGHQVTRSPVWANVAVDLVHVAAISTWLGGVAALVFVLPAATGALEAADHGELAATVVSRFSQVALLCVVLVAASGTLAAVLELQAFGDLLHSGYGRAILVKIGLLAALVGLGAVNRRVGIPRLQAAGSPPATARLLLRRTLRVELVIFAVVLGATGVLVGSAPPEAGAGPNGPFSGRAPLGPLEVRLTVDPAHAGPNRLELRLLDQRTGAPFTATKELTVTATQLAQRIGPLPVAVRRAGPGRFIANDIALAPAGTWQLHVTDRVSDFDQYETRLAVDVR